MSGALMRTEWPDLYLEPINLWNAPKTIDNLVFILWKHTNMALTHEEIREKLRQLPETDLLEVLEIYSDELVDRFDDKIEEKREQLREDLEDA